MWNLKQVFQFYIVRCSCEIINYVKLFYIPEKDHNITLSRVHSNQLTNAGIVLE